MRSLIVAEFVTLDGVMEAPGFEEHRDGRNGWALHLQSDEMQHFIRDQYASAGGFLLGRTTYQIWAAFWPTAGGDPDFTKLMNDLPKYVVSNTLREVDWSNSTLIGSDFAERVADLKRQPGGDIIVAGSADLVAGLMEHDLVDELQLMVFPVILGSGKHLFRDGVDLRAMRLVSTRSFSSGVVLLVYQPEHELPTSEYVETYSWTREQVRSLHAAENIDRVLATVLFTDIVDSTQRAAELGDRQWRQLLDRHDQVARAEVARWHGTFIKNTGDGLLATFDAPTRALRCAFGLREALRAIGLEMRAAIHTGEIEMRDGDIGGIGVHIASRALSEAGGHEVVVTRTVRDLATGTDLRFTPLASVGLRGIPGEWELFEASAE
ncbi:MAG: dihydrofolate reductase family protein [Chloroflexota bacterium]|nr:dihydrofolate reductase family protein [Chloroflexota bacterium]